MGYARSGCGDWRLGCILLAVMCLVVGATWEACVAATASSDSEYRWWPRQAVPKGVVRTDVTLFEQVSSHDGQSSQMDIHLGAEHMTVQSIAGLVAQAVNEGRSDELVWVSIPSNQEYERWYESWLQRIEPEERGTFRPWELVERYRDAGIVQGYILYRYDYSAGRVTRFRSGTDQSVNIATTLAGVLGGILISEEQEEAAKAAGLTRLADARDKTTERLLDRYAEQINRTYALAQDPQMPQNRDIAVAHRMAVVWGLEEPTETVFEWLDPMASIIGWNAGDEGEKVRQISQYGHTLLPSNWAINLCVLSAGSHTRAPDDRLTPFDPRQLDTSKRRSAIAFIMSDGDNVQWLMGDFFGVQDFWANPSHGQFPMGWGMALGCLDQVAPDVLAYAVATNPAQSTVMQHTGGYFYPDLFASRYSAEEREQMLVRHAQRINHFMKRTGARTFTFICMDVASAASRQAYEVFARELDDLVGMFAVQYAPYSGGDGDVYWVANRDGIEIPVSTAKYCLWADSTREREGTPSQIATMINQRAQDAAANDDVALEWVMTHAWSSFPSSSNHATEDGSAEKRGMGPTRWCVDRLAEDVAVVSPEELLWRIRLEHRPDQTREVIATWKP